MAPRPVQRGNRVRAGAAAGPRPRRPGQPPPEWAGAVDGRDVLARLADGELRATFTVATPAGGEHRYYTVTAGQAARSTAGTLGWHVDTRGTGGYVVAAGSVRRTAAGCRYYRLTDPGPPVPAPRWLLQLLQPPPPAPPIALTRGQRSAYGQAALAGEVALIREAGPGTRNAVAFRAAVKLGTLAAGVLDEADVPGHLRAAAGIHVGHHGFTTGEADRAIANGLHYGQQHPRRLTDS